jgi:hypothetical protein
VPRPQRVGHPNLLTQIHCPGMAEHFLELYQLKVSFIEWFKSMKFSMIKKYLLNEQFSLPLIMYLLLIQEGLYNLRVEDLEEFLSLFNCSRRGSKRELIQRAWDILDQPRLQLQAVQKVQELQAKLRV